MMNKQTMLAITLMYAVFAQAHTDVVVAKLSQPTAHELAVDDVYKLTQTRSYVPFFGGYGAFSTASQKESVEQLHSKLKKEKAADLHKKSDERLLVRAQHYLARRRSLQLSEEKKTHLLSEVQEQELAASFMRPYDRCQALGRYNKLTREAESSWLQPVMGAVVMLASRQNHSFYDSNVRVAAGFSFFKLIPMVSAVIRNFKSSVPAYLGMSGTGKFAHDDYRMAAIRYHTEKRDHARRKELIDKLGAKDEPKSVAPAATPASSVVAKATPAVVAPVKK